MIFDFCTYFNGMFFYIRYFNDFCNRYSSSAFPYKVINSAPDKETINCPSRHRTIYENPNFLANHSHSHIIFLHVESSLLSCD